MKISGFTMVRNATKYYFPIKESILSVLPVVDEFIVALGDCEPGDQTREQIESIGSDKIKIYDRVWSEDDFVESRIFAQETNFAMQQCSGDWCIYIQADEAIHENSLNLIKEECRKNIHDKNIDGLLFKYFHFWGDYNHYLPYHGWYKNEIRVVRNNAGIYSIKDAQSFRKNDNHKLNVLPIDAHIYHYGWVRPPERMQSKKKEHDSIHHGRIKTNEVYKLKADVFDYGALGRIPVFTGNHPKVMDDFRAKLSWAGQLNYTNINNLNRPKFKHEKLKYRLLSFLENTFRGGKSIFGYSNWNIVKSSKK